MAALEDGAAGGARRLAAGEENLLYAWAKIWAPEIAAELAARAAPRRARRDERRRLRQRGRVAELDELRDIAAGGRDRIVAIEARERERTGIPSLKVSYNSVFGYYIEVTRAHLATVPADYRRKQTVANGERYVTPELDEFEQTILTADERRIALELELFTALRAQVAAASERLLALAAAGRRARHAGRARRGRAPLGLLPARGRRRRASSTSPTRAIRWSSGWRPPAASSPTTSASIRPPSRS